MLCPVCKKNNAFKHEYYGYLPCSICVEKQQKYKKPSKQVEFTSESIKEQRKAHKDDILQPFNRGHLSKEYIDRWGTKRLKVMPEEIKKATNVWTDERYYK